MKQNAPKEGELYGVVNAFGISFELRYGYYDEKDRSGPPDIIYPDFIKHPIYTDTGEPLVTMMQDACKHYEGAQSRTEDETCSECLHFQRGAEWFGLCRAEKKRKNAHSNK